MDKLVRVVALGALVALLGACGGRLATAKAEFRKGRIAEAKTELVALEGESRTWNVQRRTEYALYRGLVHLSLGDRSAANVWLGEARAADDAQPHTLSDDDRVRLDLAVESLGAASAAPAP